MTWPQPPNQGIQTSANSVALTEDKNTEDQPKDVGHEIQHLGVPTGYERLVKFVADRVQRTDDENENKREVAQNTVALVVESPTAKVAEEGILREMVEFVAQVNPEWWG